MKHNLFIRIIKSKKEYLKFKGNITIAEAAQIIVFISQNNKKALKVPPQT